MNLDFWVWFLMVIQQRSFGREALRRQTEAGSGGEEVHSSIPFSLSRDFVAFGKHNVEKDVSEYIKKEFDKKIGSDGKFYPTPIRRRPRRTLPEQIKRYATRKLQEEQLKKDQPTFLNAIADVEDASDNDSGDDMGQSYLCMHSRGEGGCCGKGLLAVDDEENSVAFLDSLLLGEWEDRVQRGLFHYDVTACKTKVIPGEYGFIAQLNEGRHLKKEAN
ncbi:GDP-L-galactose phosphorylase 1 [Actinidia rufa]|uniref:GDP-L-galactose phosphorylase 1 n=1 Tax=Actinidia rufa TaxID=165716 RepID=A0A7J0E3L1_9ERIC|nr:GDP-L-galactose phosphorylase 1 [Actinidia rufa]